MNAPIEPHYTAHAHIDYISATIPSPASGEGFSSTEWHEEALAILYSWSGSPDFCHAVDQHTAKFTAGAHGFKYRLSWPDAGVFVQWGATHGRVHIVLSGVGCAVLKAVLKTDLSGDIMRRIFDPDLNNHTRIDLAVDVPTDIEPSLAATYLAPRKGTAFGLMQSVTGETVYVGSRNSEVMLRIYRWRKPHPRAHLLRWEWELKGDHAKQAAAALFRGETLKSLIGTLLKKHGVTYAPLLGLIGDTSPTPLNYKKRVEGGSVVWLFKVCIPALRDAIADGTLTREQLFKYLPE